MKMGYTEDENLPDWVKNPTCNEDERAFHDWYLEHFGIFSVIPKSARYYQMRESWMGAKKHYSNTE